MSKTNNLLCCLSIILLIPLPLVFAESIEYRMSNDIIDKNSRCYPEPFEGCALPENFICSGLGNGQCIGNDGKTYFMFHISNFDKDSNEIEEPIQFGSIAMIILIISVFCIIIITAKSKVIPRF